MPDLIKPEIQWERAERRTEDIRNPADDGGKAIENDQAIFDEKRRNPMNKRVGLWLDRNKAVIVTIANNIEGRSIITSDMENYVLYSTVVPGDGSPEEIRDRRFWNHLGEYYDNGTPQKSKSLGRRWISMNSKSAWKLKDWQNISSASRMRTK
jgi:hypothetical protein